MPSDESNSSRSSFSGLKGVWKELERKANKEWVEAKLEAIAKDEGETRDIATEARAVANMPHSCLHDEVITELRDDRKNWGKVKIGAVVIVIGLISTALANYYNLQDATEDTQEDVTELKGEVTSLKAGMQDVKTALDDDKKQRVKADERRLRDIKEAIAEAFEAKADIRPDPPRRRRQNR